MLSLTVDISILYQVVLFIILILVMNRLIYKPLLKVMEERKKRIGGFVDRATSIESEIEKKLSEYNLKVAEAKVTGNAERMKLKKEGAERESAIIETAQHEAQKAIEEARSKIAKEMEEALLGLTRMKEELGKGIAEKTLGRPV